VDEAERAPAAWRRAASSRPVRSLAGSRRRAGHDRQPDAGVRCARLVGGTASAGLFGCTAVALSRVGERTTVRAACRFYRPNPAQAAALQPAWQTALWMSGTAAGDVELYVQTARVPNAYAAGGRSVAVTSRVLEDYESGRLPEDQLVAVLVHELGHHAIGAVRPLLLVSWLAAPWRLTARLLTGLACTLAGRQPRHGPAVVVVAGLAVAVARALLQGQWMIGGVLAFVGLAVVLCPLANAAISRRSEFAADRFVANCGLAVELAAALLAMDDGRSASCGWPRRLLSSHPTSEHRIRALSRQPPPRIPLSAVRDCGPRPATCSILECQWGEGSRAR
jgi:STE24 endopeptidase